jgi:hypothetical protein
MISMRIPRLAATSNPDSHLGENILFSVIVGGIFALLLQVIEKGVTGWDVAACLMVLQSIINAVRERHSNRSIDRLGDQLGASAPQAEQASGKPNDPIHLDDGKPPAPLAGND